MKTYSYKMEVIYMDNNVLNHLIENFGAYANCYTVRLPSGKFLKDFHHMIASDHKSWKIYK